MAGEDNHSRANGFDSAMVSEAHLAAIAQVLEQWLSQSRSPLGSGFVLMVFERGDSRGCHVVSNATPSDTARLLRMHLMHLESAGHAAQET